MLYTAFTNVGCVGLRTDGLVVAAGLQLLLLRKDGSVVVLVEVLGEFANHAFNDGAVGQQGRMLSGAERSASHKASPTNVRCELALKWPSSASPVPGAPVPTHRVPPCGRL